MTPFPDSVQLPGKTVHRRWRVPAAAVSGMEPLDGSGVLRENRGQRGLVLWQALRDATLWAQTPPSERKGLFSPEAGARRTAAMLAARLETSLSGPFAILTELVKQPEQIRAEQLTLACREVSSWAEARGVLATAQGYAEAAALVSPADASAAFKAGQLARKCADYPRAERWLRMAARTGRNDANRLVSALALVALGNVYRQRGNFPKARKFYLAGLRLAGKHGLHDVRGRALHDLLGIAALSNNLTEAEEYGRDAFWAYGPDHAKIPVLANDLAYLWMAQGQYGRALPVFKAVAGHLNNPRGRLTVLSNTARAAGELNDRTSFREAWQEALCIVGRSDTTDAAAEAYLELARGATALNEQEKAEFACGRALTLSTERGEARILLMAETLMEEIRSDGGRVHNDHTEARGFAPPDSFADCLIESLNEYAGAA